MKTATIRGHKRSSASVRKRSRPRSRSRSKSRTYSQVLARYERILDNPTDKELEKFPYPVDDVVNALYTAIKPPDSNKGEKKRNPKLDPQTYQQVVTRLRGTLENIQKTTPEAKAREFSVWSMADWLPWHVRIFAKTVLVFLMVVRAGLTTAGAINIAQFLYDTVLSLVFKFDFASTSTWDSRTIYYSLIAFNFLHYFISPFGTVVQALGRASHSVPGMRAIRSSFNSALTQAQQYLPSFMVSAEAVNALLYMALLCAYVITKAHHGDLK